jgi:fibronectin type 3 domain-containing protein
MPQKWTEQFSATVSGTANTAVTWGITRGTGTVTQKGLFTAPQVVETDVVMVTSAADPTKTASAVITIVPPHSVSLNWDPSSSANVSSYNVYRATTSGGPYSMLQTGLVSTSFTDSNVQPGAVYYYVTTAVDTSQAESVHSNEVQAVIPSP